MPELRTRIAGLRNVSWVAFATWASKTAGVSIRKEQLSDLLRTHLEESDDWAHVTGEIRSRLLERALGDVNEAVSRIFRRSIDRMSEVIAEGNRTVFAELGPIFARLASLDDGARNPGALDGFVATVTAIDSVDGAATERLRQAFRIYHVIWHSPEDAADLRAVTQQVLLANGLIGLTEQIRLQPPSVARSTPSSRWASATSSGRCSIGWCPRRSWGSWKRRWSGCGAAP